MTRIVLDTNVFVSGVFWRGAPAKIVDAWASAKIGFVLSLEILEEYQRVCKKLAAQFPSIPIDPILEQVAARAELWQAPALIRQVCSDPDDDKFLAAAMASRADAVVTGDKPLLKVKNFAGIPIVTPRQFLNLL